MLSSVSNTDTMVNAGYGDRPPQIPGDLFNRLKLLSKLISQKSSIDRVMTYVNLKDNIEGQENGIYFNAFIRYWHVHGWVGLRNFYNTIANRSMRMTEASYMTLDERTKAAMGVCKNRTCFSYKCQY